MIEFYSHSLPADRVDELLDIVLRDREPGEPLPRLEAATERRYVESIQHGRRAIRSMHDRWVPPAKTVDFIHASASDLKDWFDRSVSRLGARETAELHCQAAATLMDCHGPFRRCVVQPSATSDGQRTKQVTALLSAHRLASATATPASELASASRTHVDQALSLDSTAAEPHSHAAWWEWFFGNPHSAHDHFTLRLRHAEDPRTRTASRNCLALFLNDFGDFRSAERLVLQAFALDKPTTTALLNAAIWADCNGHKTLSRQLVRELLDRRDSSSLITRLGWGFIGEVYKQNRALRDLDPSDEQDFLHHLSEAFLYGNPR